jgi:tetratricopeptide (TPR) repeat protein
MHTEMTEAINAACASLRLDEAQAVVELVLNSPARVVVILGPRNSGKSEFIRCQVVPRLESYGPVLLFDCLSGLTEEICEALTRPATVVILDSFDRFLCSSGEGRDAALRSLFTEHRHATLVLITDCQSLPEIFSLRQAVPDILDNFFELTELKLSTELPRFRSSPGVGSFDWDPRLIRGLEVGLSRLPDPVVTVPLVAIIDESVRSGDYDQRLVLDENVRTDSYDPKLGILDLLERYLERTLALLDSQPGYGEDASEAARALLKEVIRQHKTVSLVGLPEQLDLSPEILAKSWQWLVQTSGVLTDSHPEGLALTPPQLRVVLEKWLDEDENACARAERSIADGMDARRKLGALLPYDRFIDIHAQRKSLRTTPEQASYLTLCALRSCPDADPGPIEYWFRRIAEPALQMNALLDALAYTTPRTRYRAAQRLASFDDPKVHGHLCRAALEDPAVEVRRQAVESLSNFKNKGPIREVLMRTASDEKSVARIHAIEALRLFPDEECVRFLESIVSRLGELPVREASIDALSQTRCDIGVAALVRIALWDVDQEDRDRAEKALSLLDLPSLVECGLNATFEDWTARRPTPEGRWWKKFGFWPATLAILAVGLFVHCVPFLILRKWLAVLAFLILEVGCLWLGIAYLPRSFSLIPFFLSWCASVTAAAWVARQKHPRPGTFQSVFSSSLLANTIISCGAWLHGVGHWITGRRRQAWQLLGIEMIALLAMLSVLEIQNVFTVGITQADSHNFRSVLVFAYDSLTSFLFYLYLVGGLAVSWLLSASWLFMDEKWGKRGPWVSEPHSRVLRALLRAPKSAELLRARLVAEPAKASFARMLLTHLGEAVPGDALLSVLEQDMRQGNTSPPAIVHCLSRNKNNKGYEVVVKRVGELFDSVPPDRMRPLIDVLATRPTDASVRILLERHRTLRRWNRLRVVFAAIIRPFQGWHWLVRVAVFASSLLLLILVIDSLRTSINPAWSQIKQYRRLAKFDFRRPWYYEGLRGESGEEYRVFRFFPTSEYQDKSRDFATVATFLSSGDPRITVDALADTFPWIDKKYAPSLAASLGTIAISEDAGARKTALEALGAAVMTSEGESNPEEDKDRRMRAERALSALQDAADRRGSQELVHMLSDFLDQPHGRKTLLDATVLQARAVAMLAGVARQSSQDKTASSAAKDVIASHADLLVELQRSSADPAFQSTVFEAFEMAARPDAIKTIKESLLRKSAAEISESTGNRYSSKASSGAAARLDASARLRVMAVHLTARAQELQEAGTLDEALTTARSAVEADEHYVRAYCVQAHVMEDLKLYDDARAVLRKAIRIDPTYPWSYSILIDTYHAQDRDRDAISELLRLQRTYPTAGAICFYLALVYHERIAREDPAAYQLAYQNNQKVVNLERDRDQNLTLAAELNLEENRLTTGRYAELVEKQPELLKRVGEDSDARLGLTLLMLAAQVLAHDSRNALGTLADLERIYEGEVRPAGKPSTWVYFGTEAYLEKRVPRSPQTIALLALVHGVNNISGTGAANTPPPVIPQELFEQLRKALE